MWKLKRFWFFLLWLVVLAGCATAVSPTPTPLPISPPTTPTLPTGPAAAPDLIWQAALGDGLVAPVQLAGGRVIAATDTAVIALDPESGTELWRVQPDNGVWSRSLAAAGERVYIGVPGGLLALQAADGAILWEQPTVGEVLWPPLAQEDRVFAGTAFVGPGVTPDPSGQGQIYAWDAADGRLVWSVETAVYALTTPAAAGDLVVVGGSYQNEADVAEGGHMRLHALDRQDGQVRWTSDNTDGFLKSLAVDEARVYYLAYTDMLYALDAQDGAPSWRYPTENWSPGFTLAEGVLYLGSDNAFVHAVAGNTGRAVWRQQLAGIFNSPRARPLAGQQRLYFQGNDNQLYAFDLADGHLLWQTAPQPRSRVTPTVDNGRLFLVGQDETLYAFAAP